MKKKKGCRGARRGDGWRCSNKEHILESLDGHVQIFANLKRELNYTSKLLYHFPIKLYILGLLKQLGLCISILFPFLHLHNTLKNNCVISYQSSRTRVCFFGWVNLCLCLLYNLRNFGWGWAIHVTKSTCPLLCFHYHHHWKWQDRAFFILAWAQRESTQGHSATYFEASSTKKWSVYCLPSY
jgi:hypothetical protein